MIFRALFRYPLAVLALVDNSSQCRISWTARRVRDMFLPQPPVMLVEIVDIELFVILKRAKKNLESLNSQIQRNIFKLLLRQ